MTLKRSASKRIIINTIVVYCRSIISAVLYLISSRWILQALGTSDFGLYALVGSIILFISFFNSVLSNSVSRHFAFEISNLEGYNVNKWFNSALSLHALLSIILILLGYPIGSYLICEVLEIDQSRVNAAIVVFQVSLISGFFGMISTPFTAMFIAKQNFFEPSIIGILQAFLIFIASYSLLIVEGDKLILYAIFMVSIYVFIFVLQIIRTMQIYTECKINFELFFNKSCFSSIFYFSIWNLIANLGHLIRTQGMTIITNIFWGVQSNAALSISNQISTQTSQLTNALSNAANPEIIRRIGRGESENAIELSNQATKLGIFLILILSIPFLTEADNVLKLWLDSVPEGTSVLSKLFILMYVIEKSTLGQQSLLQGIGKIAKSQTCSGLIFIFSLVLVYIFIFLKLGLMSVGLACVSTMILNQFSIVYWVNKYMRTKLRDWLKHILVPYACITMTLFFVSLFFTNLIQESLIRLLCNFLINFVLSVCLVWFFLLNLKERKMVKELILKL